MWRFKNPNTGVAYPMDSRFLFPVLVIFSVLAGASLQPSAAAAAAPSAGETCAEIRRQILREAQEIDRIERFLTLAEMTAQDLADHLHEISRRQRTMIRLMNAYGRKGCDWDAMPERLSQM